MAGAKILTNLVDDVLGLAAKEAPEAAAGIRAYHASPYDFDKFDLSKVGTGEGAQAFGHGMYYSDDPRISGRGGKYWTDFLRTIPNPTDREAVRTLADWNFNNDKAIANLLRRKELTITNPFEDLGDGAKIPHNIFIHNVDDEISKIDQMIQLLQSKDPLPGPRAYEVNINAKPEQLLDWDKPIREQSPYVLNALNVENPKSGAVRDRVDALNAEIQKLTATKDYSYFTLEKMFEPDPVLDALILERDELSKSLNYALPLDHPMYGKTSKQIGDMEVYQLVKPYGQSHHSVAASEALAKAGIPGLHYPTGSLSGFSDDNMHRNYVVFDPTKVDIVNKFANGGRIAKGGAGAVLGATETLLKKLAKEAPEGMVIGSFPGKTLPSIDALSRGKDKFIYHSGTADLVPEMKYGIEPQIGPWVREVLEGATDDDQAIRDILENSPPVAWWSKDPSWVSAKVSRKLDKPVRDVTDDEIVGHGHVAMFPRKVDPLTRYEGEQVYWVGDEGLMNGPYSIVEDLSGNKMPAYRTDLFEGNYGPEGVERNEYITRKSIEPWLHLTGPSLLDFLKKTGHRAVGGRVAKAGAGAVEDVITAALRLAGKEAPAVVGKADPGLEVLRQRAAEMELPKAQRTQPSGYQIFETTPEAYKRTESIVPQESFMGRLPRPVVGKALPLNERLLPILEIADDVAAQYASKMAPYQGKNVEYFYHTGPVYEKAFDLLGNEGAGREFMDRFSKTYAGTSPRTPTEQNLLNSSLLSYRVEQGLPLEKPVLNITGNNDVGYPMISGMHPDLTRRLLAGEDTFANNPKPSSFAENVRGNLQGVTADTHNIRGILRSYEDLRPGSIPREWFKTDVDYDQYLRGGLTPDILSGGINDSLASQAVNKVSRQSEYGPMADITARSAEILGEAPAPTQSLGWFGLGDMTNLRSAPKTLTELMGERIDVTAQKLGIDPDEVARLYMQGKIPLMNQGGRVEKAGGGGLTEEALEALLRLARKEVANNNSAMNVIEGGLGEAASNMTAASRAAENAKAIETAKRLGYDPSNVNDVREAQGLQNYHTKLMGEVADRAKAQSDLVRQYIEEGRFPLEVGTRYQTSKGMEQGALPWEVTGYYVDPKNPAGRYGYYVRRGDEEGGTHMIRDPKLEQLHGPEKWEKLQADRIPMFGPRVVKAYGGAADDADIDAALMTARTEKASGGAVFYGELPDLPYDVPKALTPFSTPEMVRRSEALRGDDTDALLASSYSNDAISDMASAYNMEKYIQDVHGGRPRPEATLSSHTPTLREQLIAMVPERDKVNVDRIYGTAELTGLPQFAEAHNKFIRTGETPSGYDQAMMAVDMAPGVLLAGAKPIYQGLKAGYQAAKPVLKKVGLPTAVGTLGLTAGSEDAEAGIIGEGLAKGSSALMDALNLAKKMKDEGASVDEIWDATKWYKAPDVKRADYYDQWPSMIERPVEGKWKTYIDPKNARFDTTLSDQPQALADVLDFPELYALSPEIKDTVKIITGSPKIEGAAYNPQTRTIKIGDVSHTFYSPGGIDPYQNSAAHELEHAIQHAGSEWNDQWYNGTNRQKALEIARSAASSWDVGKKFGHRVKKDPNMEDKLYFANPGEEEARNASYRFSLPALRDKPIPLTSDMSVPLFTPNLMMPLDHQLLNISNWDPYEFYNIKGGNPVLNINKRDYTYPTDYIVPPRKKPNEP